MKPSSDREIERAEDLFTVEARRRGEESGDQKVARHRVIDHAVSSCHPERARVSSFEASGSRRTPRMPAAKTAASGSSPHALACVRRRFQNACRIIRTVIREIFDESAYDRFLLRTKASYSIESYRAFMREREASIAQKPRCC